LVDFAREFLSFHSDIFEFKLKQLRKERLEMEKKRKFKKESSEEQEDDFQPKKSKLTRQVEEENEEDEEQNEENNEQSEGEEENEESSEKKDDFNPFAKLTPLQQRLAVLKKKADLAKQDNFKELVAEDKRNSESQDSKRAAGKREYQMYKEEERKRLAPGAKDDKLELLTTTAAEAEWKNWKKKDNPQEDREDDKPDLNYRSYEFRTKEVDFKYDDYEKMKKSMLEEDFYRDADNPNYSNPPPPSEEKLNKMVEELNKTQSRRSKARRRSKHYEEAFVDYINEGNKAFNKKIGRAFDKYTAEIKQNLERGTAI